MTINVADDSTKGDPDLRLVGVQTGREAMKIVVYLYIKKPRDTDTVIA